MPRWTFGAIALSQPTISRAENSCALRDVFRMLLSLVDLHCLNACREEPESVVIDIDDSFHETHGGQRLSLFDKFSDGHGCMPLHFCDANANAVIAVALRPGKTMSGVELRRHLRIMDDRPASGQDDVGCGTSSPPEDHGRPPCVRARRCRVWNFVAT